MNTDSINDPKNDLNHYIYEGVKGFYRITFEPFLKVITKFLFYGIITLNWIFFV